MFDARSADRYRLAQVAARFGLALAGALYSAHLTYLELFAVHANCPWWVASTLLMVAILVLAWLEVGAAPAPERP